jgi:hypothetical protein
MWSGLTRPSPAMTVWVVGRSIIGATGITPKGGQPLAHFVHRYLELVGELRPKQGKMEPQITQITQMDAGEDRVTVDLLFGRIVFVERVAVAL